MSLESDLYNLMSADASIQAVLDAEPFVYNGAIPKGKPDSGAIVINISRTDRLTGTDGPNNLVIREVQLDSYHEKYTQSLAMSTAIFNLMVSRDLPLLTIEFRGAIPTAEMDFGKEPAQTPSGYVFRRMLRFEVQYVDLPA
jgi:hypothetical protein